MFPRIAEQVYPWDDLGEHVRSFTLPAVTLALPAAAVLTRLLRADLVLTLQSDFVLVAKAKGISPRRIMWRHALPNSMFTLLSSVGVQVGVIVGGAVVVETFFDLDGMGLLLVARRAGQRPVHRAGDRRPAGGRRRRHQSRHRPAVRRHRPARALASELR